MDQKPPAVAGKNKSGIKNEPAQEIQEATTEDMSTPLMAGSSTKGQQSGVKKTRKVVKHEASSTQADKAVQVNSSDDLKSRDAKFEKYLKDLDCKIRETLKLNPLPPNPLVELNNHLKTLTENQMKQKEDRSKQEEQLKEQCCQLVSLLQQLCSPTEVWNWEAWDQMSLQEQKQPKQLVEKYMAVERYLIIEDTLSKKLRSLSLDKTYILNPLEYASDPHVDYVTKYCGRKKVLFVGINPNRHGMSQNGVPFGSMDDVTDWLKIVGDVKQPAKPCPKFTVDGFAHKKHEGSGQRFWGLVRDMCGTPEVFFQNCFVRNYCPLLFLGPRGNYLSLSIMSAETRKKFEPHCNKTLLACVEALGVERVVAVGDYVTKRANKALTDMSIQVVKIPHPSRHNTTWKDDNDWKQQVKNALGKEILKIMNPSYTTPKNAPAK